jgi:6-phosphogluconolactonase (cycloisomerase 2 family)
MGKSILLLFFAALANVLFGQNMEKTYLFVGTYTEGQPDTGIYVYTFDTNSGELKRTGIVSDITNPSFLTISANGRYLYACTDTKMPEPGSVTAFKFDSVHGQLTLLNKQPSGGENPVYVAAHKSNKFVACANYTGGSVSIFSTNHDGSLNPYTQLIPFTGSSIIPDRQDKPYIHAAVFSPKGDYLILPDLGADLVRVMKLDITSPQPLKALLANNVHVIPGSGPRHFTFHPTLPYAYCIEELSGMVSAYKYDHGQLDSMQRIFSYSKTGESYLSADIHISPDGLFLYASNRETDNTISIFGINQQSGLLSLAGHESTLGVHPRNFTIDPTGNFLLVANLASNNIVVFRRNLKTGLLKKTKYEIKVPSPSCLQMRTYH